MKKGNKVLALFLAAVMLATSIAWDFGGANVAEAADVDAGSQAYLEYDFESMTDVSVLDADFTAHTQNVNGAESSVADNWFSGKSATGADTSQVNGLKVKKRETSTYRYLKHKNTYTNFHAIIEMYSDTNTMVVVGGEPTSGGPAEGNTNAFMFWFSSTTGAAWRGGGKAQETKSGFVKNTPYTLHIRVEDGTLSAWFEEINWSTCFSVGSNFVSPSNICLRQKRNYDSATSGGMNGGFSSLAIRDLDASHAEGYYDFENVNTTNLTDFTSTQFEKTNKTIIGEANQLVSAQWYSGKSGTLQVDESTSVANTSANWGLKPLADTDNAYNHFLNYKDTYKNFQCSAELYFASNQGIVIGEENVYPSATASNAIIIWATGNNTIAMQGGVKGNTAKVSGENAGWSGSGPYNFKFSSANPTVGTNFKINVKLEDRILYVSVDGYDAQLQIEVKDDFPTDVKVALWSRNYVTDCVRGFKSFEFNDLDNKVVFSESGIENLTDFTASMRDKGTAEFIKTNVTPSEVWYTGTSGTSASGVENTSTNEGLKALADSSTDNSYDHYLYYKNSYKNYKATVQLRKYGNVGFMIGEQNVHPTSSSTETGIMIWFPNNTFALQGALDWSDYTYIENGVQKSTSGSGNQRNIRYADSNPAEGTLLTVEIEMIEGYLIVSTGYSSLTVKVSSSFPQEGSFGLWNRNYKTNKGGFESFAIREVRVNTGTTVDVENEDGSRYTEFDHVDVEVLTEKGFTASRYNVDTYETIGLNKEVAEYWAAGNDVSSTNAGLKANVVKSERAGTLLNTPYSYNNFRVSTDIYLGTGSGIVLGEENVVPTLEAEKAIQIYLNANSNGELQLQLSGGGFDYESVQIAGDTATWNPRTLDTNKCAIFKLADGFKAQAGKVFRLNVEYVDGVITIWIDGANATATFKAMDAFCEVQDKNIALYSRGYNSDGGGFKSLTVKELEDVVISYTAEEFATYRAEGEYSAPVYNNYLFAGWYTDAACTLETAVETTTTEIESEVVYAKFVPRYILTVKAQVSAEVLDNDLANDTKGNIRFATTVDSSNYSQVGFDISYVKNGEVKEQQKASNIVYETLNAINGVTYTPDEFCRASIYFKACTVKNVGADYFDVEFNVTPFWKTLDGTRVEGDTVVKTINQGRNASFLEGKTALFLGDSIQDGGNYDGQGLGEDGADRAWYDRLARYYGMVTEEVASKGWALTNKETSGRSQIVTQLEKATAQTYDFVILEGGVNDVRIDQDTQNPDIVIDWGSVDEDPSKEDYGDSTIAGAMQNLIIATQKKFPDAEVVYIINHYYGATDANMKKYVAMVKAACRVHNISYVDLSDIEAYPTLEPLSKQSADYVKDDLHPRAAGYELSTPVIANHLRGLVTGEVKDVVYVASTGTDAIGNGTESAPYQTLNYAVSKVADGGTIYVQDTLVCKNTTGNNFSLGGYGFETGQNIESNTNVIDKVNHKQVTIAGANDSAKLDFSGANNVFLNESVILEDIQVAWPSRIRAEGNTFIVKESIKQVGTTPEMVIGGSHYHDLEKTDLRIYGGTYKKIIGGQQKLHVEETNVVVGGSVNNGIDTSSHDHTYILLGGNYSEGAACTVRNTNVMVENGAKFNYVFGAGAKAEGVADNITCAVLGDTNVTFAGEAYGVYGGACARITTKEVNTIVTCVNTNVRILDGAKVAQVFGGSEHAAISGNANVQLLGGQITRRVWGGCYNEEEPAAYYANGTVTITVDSGVTIDKVWHGFAAASRYNVSSASTETGIFIFNDYTKNSGKISKISAYYGEGDKSHDYIVKVDANGTAKVVDGKLVVIPNSGYTIASVTGATDNGDGTYTFTATEVMVTFASSN